LEKSNTDLAKTLGTLKQVQIDAYKDIINGAITVLTTLVFVILLPYISLLIFRDGGNTILEVIEVVASGLVFYVSISRLGFMIWDIWRILSWANIQTEKFEETSQDPKLYSYLKREDRIIKKIISLLSISIMLIYLQFSGKFLIILNLTNTPSIFMSEPTLVFLPVHVIILFSIVYDVPILMMLHEKVLNELVEDKIVQILFKESKCPICGNLIPKKAVHCPYCGIELKPGDSNV